MPATELKIRTYGDPVLRKKALPVAKVLADHSRILSEMARLMYDSGGIGLAAPQVGISQALIVVDIGQGLYKLINPQVVKKAGSQAIEEGCLSVPGVCLKVRRAKKVQVKALDETGKPLVFEAEGLFACVLQHEIDHLRGKLIIDYASVLDKLRIRKALAALKGSKNKACELRL